VPLTSLVVPRLGTTNGGGGGGTTLPAEAKIIVSVPYVHVVGWGGNAGSINSVFRHLCVPGQQSDSQQLASSWKGY